MALAAKTVGTSHRLGNKSGWWSAGVVDDQRRIISRAQRYVAAIDARAGGELTAAVSARLDSEQRFRELAKPEERMPAMWEERMPADMTEINRSAEAARALLPSASSGGSGAPARATSDPKKRGRKKRARFEMC